jgi:hypothetical protein
MGPLASMNGQSREPFVREEISIIDLLAFTSLDKMVLKLQTLFAYLQNKLPHEEVNRTEPSLSVSIPWPTHWSVQGILTEGEGLIQMTSLC